MTRIKIVWENSQEHIETINQLKAELIKYNLVHTGSSRSQPNYVLNIKKEAELTCDVSELAQILNDAVKIGGFDQLNLDDFKSVASLNRVNSKGLSKCVILPVLFIKRPIIQKSLMKLPSSTVDTNVGQVLARTDVDNRHNNQQIVRYQENNGNRGILLAAFTFFIFLILGGVYLYRRRLR